MTNYHTHSCFSDGKNTPEEMVLAALALGMTELGFSDHSFAAFDLECGIPEGQEAEYRSVIAALKEKYAGRIRILCGLEQDYCSEPALPGYDFLIGSVHYLPMDGAYLPVDNTPELLREGIDHHFDGDGLAFAERFWALAGDVAEKTGCSLIGHLDLIRKFNQDGSFFDENAPRYKNAAIAAIDRLLEAKIPFEVNTGAISRGWQDFPYPSRPLQDYIRARGGCFLMSSDCHRAQDLIFGFDRFRPENCLDTLPLL